jgi:hypothetical protein
MVEGTPQGVADGTLRDDVDDTLSRAYVEPFWSSGALLEPVLGPRHRGTRVRVYFGGNDTLLLEFGDFGHKTEVWTTRAGLDALIGDLLAAKVRADIAIDGAAVVHVADEDIPW